MFHLLKFIRIRDGRFPVGAVSIPHLPASPVSPPIPRITVVSHVGAVSIPHLPALPVSPPIRGHVVSLVGAVSIPHLLALPLSPPIRDHVVSVFVRFPYRTCPLPVSPPIRGHRRFPLSCCFHTALAVITLVAAHPTITVVSVVGAVSIPHLPHYPCRRPSESRSFPAVCGFHTALHYPVVAHPRCLALPRRCGFHTALQSPTRDFVFATTRGVRAECGMETAPTSVAEFVPCPIVISQPHCACRCRRTWRPRTPTSRAPSPAMCRS